MSTKLIGSKYCYISLTIQLNISHLSPHSYMIKQLYFKQSNLASVICWHSFKKSNSSIWPIHRTEPEWTWERWQWLDTPHSPKFQHHWRRTIRLFNVIFKTLIGEGSDPSAEVQSVYSAAPAYWAVEVK